MSKMFPAFKKNQKNNKLWLGLYREVVNNWESYYVMIQQKRFFLFLDDCLSTWSSGPDCALGEYFDQYKDAIANFNRTYKEVADFEVWYASDINNQTRENAQRLHILKEEVRQVSKGMDRVIQPVKDQLEQRLRLIKLLP